MDDELLRCQTCGEPFDYPLPPKITERQARHALGEVLRWYAESPIREIQMASDMCGMKFPMKEIEIALGVPPPGHHWSDCAVNNGPALPVGPCDCGVEAHKSATSADDSDGTF